MRILPQCAAKLLKSVQIAKQFPLFSGNSLFLMRKRVGQGCLFTHACKRFTHVFRVWRLKKSPFFRLFLKKIVILHTVRN